MWNLNNWKTEDWLVCSSVDLLFTLLENGGCFPSFIQWELHQPGMTFWIWWRMTWQHYKQVPSEPVSRCHQMPWIYASSGFFWCNRILAGRLWSNLIKLETLFSSSYHNTTIWIFLFFWSSMARNAPDLVIVIGVISEIYDCSESHRWINNLQIFIASWQK